MGQVGFGHRSKRPAAVLGILALLGVGSLTGVSAAPASMAPTSARTLIKAPADATWYGQMNATTVCRLLPGCVSSTAVKGGYRLSLRGSVDGIGQITQDVTATVIKQTPPRLMRLRLSSQSGLGSLTSTVTVTLSTRGAKSSALSVRVTKTSGTGALGSIVVPLLASRLQTGLTSYGQDLNRQIRAANLRVNATVQRKGSKRIVKARVVQANPIVQGPASATGKARVTTGKGKILCTSKVAKAKAKCSYRKGPKKPRVVVTGEFSNGFQVWVATTAQVTK